MLLTDGADAGLFNQLKKLIILVSKEGEKYLTKEPAARDFIVDAFAHLKFIAMLKKQHLCYKNPAFFMNWMKVVYCLIKNLRPKHLWKNALGYDFGGVKT